MMADAFGESNSKRIDYTYTGEQASEQMRTIALVSTEVVENMVAEVQNQLRFALSNGATFVNYSIPRMDMKSRLIRRLRGLQFVVKEFRASPGVIFVTASP